MDDDTKISEATVTTTLPQTASYPVALVGDTTARRITHATLRGGVFNVQDYGAVGDGATDDTIAIRAAIAACPTVANRGSTLFFPDGSYLLSRQAAETELLLISKNISLVGASGTPILAIAASVPGTVDVIRVSIAGEVRLLSIQNLFIRPVSGTPARYGINLDVTSAGQRLANLLIASCHIEQLGTGSVHLTNPTNTDGFFGSHIEKNFLVGGISLERCGDSVTIRDNIIAGTGIGIDMTTVPGALQTLIEGNNITSTGECIQVTTGDQVKIVHNQIESVLDYIGASGALVNIAGSAGVHSVACEIANNNINGAIPSTKPTNLIRVDYGEDTVIRDNNLQKGSGSSVLITANALDTKLGPNRWGTAEIAPSVSDSGVGTRNISKTPASIVAGWGNYAGLQPATFRKDDDGRVSLGGMITTTLNPPTFPVTLFILPVGFRPVTLSYFQIGVMKAAVTASTGIVSIATSGEIAVQNGPTAVNDSVVLDGISFMAAEP